MSQHNTDEFELPAWSDELGDMMASGEDLDAGRIELHFPDGSEPMSVSRRDFLRVAGAAAAATGISAAAGCRVPQDKIVPYVDRPEEVYHGVPNTYTSVCRGCASQCGILMTVREGRVTKLEGNPDHPISRGGLCARGQAAVTDAYSADRLRAPQKVGRTAAAETTWAELDKAVSAALAAARGGKVRLLTGAVGGPAQAALIEGFLKNFKDGEHVAWEPMAPSALAAAHTAAYGQSGLPFYRFDKASAVVSFGSEFLDTLQGQTRYTRDFAATRNPDAGDKMSHLTVFEGRMTLTGGAADIRHRVRTSDLLYVALSVAAELVAAGVSGPLAGNPTVKATLGGYSADTIGPKIGVDAASIKAVAARLKAAGKAGLAIAGRGGAGDDGSKLAVAAALINELLGAVGTTVDHSRTLNSPTDWAGLEAMTKELAAGQVQVLIISGVNPVYDLPPALGFEKAMAGAKTIIVADTMLHETAIKADWVATTSHFLEAWGDSEPQSGVYALQQPGMQPLHKTRSLESSLLTWAPTSTAPGVTAALKAHTDYKDALRRPSPGPWHFYLESFWQGDFFAKLGSPLGGARFWEAVARKGVFTDRKGGQKPGAFKTGALSGVSGTRPDKPVGKLELEIYATQGVYDGRGAANGMLLELVDTVTKTCWDNYVCVSPRRFGALGLSKLGDKVKLTSPAGAVELPAMMVPGMHDDVVSVPAGYGRTHAGVIGTGVGVNIGPLVGRTDAGPQYAGLAVEAVATGGFEELGQPRGSVHVIDPNERHILPFTTMAEYKANPKSGAEQHILPGMWGEGHKYPDLKWGMAIDLSRCTGCAACLIACQVENNIPVVGKTGVLEGRLMQWIRIDRYYALPDPPEGKPHFEDELLDSQPMVAAADYLENPQMLLEPMMCQHCDNAPCETVCPVAATVHSEDGLNEQVYNRCVGTRYCANNCPYKVRRFNWYRYTKDRSDEFVADIFEEIKEIGALNGRWPSALRFNPEVTVRARGVMEKCTFCVQRLRRSSKIYRKAGMAGPDPQTACQQTCPAQAIEFGNTSDPKSAVSKAVTGSRSFGVIAEIGTQPAVRYLTRVRHSEA